jgi:hypothetical protein
VDIYFNLYAQHQEAILSPGFLTNGNKLLLLLMMMMTIVGPFLGAERGWGVTLTAHPI